MARQLRWGILGTANIADTLVKAIRACEGNIVRAVASRNADRARKWAEERGIPRAFGSYEALLSSGEVDCIYIPLPNSLHAEWSIRAMEAGLPVLCEKPFALNAAEARQVAEVSRRTGVLIAEAFMYRFHPVYSRILETIREGKIGQVTSIHSQFTFRLDSRSEIPANAELGGGSLMDVGCYPVNFSRLIAGCEPERAFAFERRSTVDDTLMGMLEFPNGILAQFESSIENHERHRAEIAGTEGSILMERPWHAGEAQESFRLCRGEMKEDIHTPGGDAYRLEVEDFAHALTTGGKPRWPVDDAVANMAVIDALCASARTGRAEAVEKKLFF